MCRSVLKEIADSAVEMAEMMKGVESWDAWEEEECKYEESSKRSMKEERRLWKALEESDKEQAKEEERRLKKGAGSTTPG